MQTATVSEVEKMERRESSRWRGTEGLPVWTELADQYQKVKL